MLRPFFEAYEIVADVLRDAPAEIDEKELTEEGAGRRPPVRRAEPGAQQRVGVGAAVRDRAAGRRRPASAGTRGRSRRAPRRRSARTARRSAATWTRSSRSPASSSTRARCSDARCAASLPRTACGPAVRDAIRWAHDHRRAPACAASAVWPVLFGVALLAGVTAAGIGALSLADALTATGLPDPGPRHHVRPAVRAGGRRDRGRRGGRIVPVRGVPGAAADQRRARRRPATARCGSARVASAVWTVCAALLVPLTVSDVSGQPLRDHLSPVDIWSVASLVDTAGAWRWTAFLAAAVTVASIPVLRWSWTPLLFAGALVTLMPLALTRALVGGRLARPGHQQPAHPPDRRARCGRAACWRCWRTRCAAASTPTSPRGGSPRSRCGASWRWR